MMSLLTTRHAFQATSQATLAHVVLCTVAQVGVVHETIAHGVFARLLRISDAYICNLHSIKYTETIEVQPFQQKNTILPEMHVGHVA